MLLGAAGIAWICARLAGLALRRWSGEVERAARFEHVVLVAILAAAAALQGWLLGRDLASGTWIQTQLFAPAVRFGPALALAGAVPIWERALALGSSTRPRDQAVSTLGFVCLAVGIAVLDAKLLYGLYSLWHFFLEVVSQAAWLSALLPSARFALRAARPALLWPSCTVLAALIIAPAHGWLDADANVRAELSLRGWYASPWDPPMAEASRADLVAGELTRLTHQKGRPFQISQPYVPSWGSHGVTRDADIVLVVVDTLRADALGPWRRQGADVTPRIDAWLEHSTRFRHAYSTAPITTRAMPSLFHSQEVNRLPADPAVHLGRELGAVGYHSVAIVPSWMLDLHTLAEEKKQITAGFDRSIEYAVDRSEQTVEELEAVLDETPRPLFAWVHFLDLHQPRYTGRGAPAGGASRQAYERSLQWVDELFGRILDALERRGRLESTIVALASDHGEAFGEHGNEFHGKTLFEEEIRVPLAIAAPGIAPRIAELYVNHLDVAPTLLDLAGAPPEPRYAGRTLVPVMRGAAPESQRVLYVENFSGHRAAVLFGAHKLVYRQNIGALYHYDLERDPGELSGRYDPEAPVDRFLLRSLIEHRPDFARSQAQKPSVVPLLSDLLSRDEATIRDDGVAYALAVAAACGSEECLTLARALAERSAHPPTKRRVQDLTRRARPRRASK